VREFWDNLTPPQAIVAVVVVALILIPWWRIW
jgi:hypothetical protein